MTLFVFRLAYAESQPPDTSKLQSIEKEIVVIKKSQIAILESQNQIIEEIKNLKVWTNKHRKGGP